MEQYQTNSVVYYTKLSFDIEISILTVGAL